MHTPMPPRFDHQYGPHSSQMSMRDYFAGQALVGLLGNSRVKDNISNDSVAASCYAMADAMMKERDKQEAK